MQVTLIGATLSDALSTEELIEHGSLTFLIEGISRACSHQLVRHRIASYSQESQRYVEMSDPQYVVPPAVAGDPAARAIWDEFTAQAGAAYSRLRALGVRKEDSRFLLPNATATRLVMSITLRSLRHLCEVRCAKDAQWEVRALALEMLRLAHGAAPAAFADLAQRFL